MFDSIFGGHFGVHLRKLIVGKSETNTLKKPRTENVSILKITRSQTLQKMGQNG